MKLNFLFFAFELKFMEIFNLPQLSLSKAIIYICFSKIPLINGIARYRRMEALTFASFACEFLAYKSRLSSSTSIAYFLLVIVICSRIACSCTFYNTFHRHIPTIMCNKSILLCNIPIVMYYLI